jgi:uncharacterized membrane protein YkvA (DUF1232 family)
VRGGADAETDAAAGTAVDAAGGDGAVADAATDAHAGICPPGSPGPAGAVDEAFAVTFDGVDDMARLGWGDRALFRAGDPISVMGWVNPTFVDGYDTIVARPSPCGNSGNFMVDLNGGALRFCYVNATHTASHCAPISTGAIPLGAWTHFAMTYRYGDFSSFRAWVDGALERGRVPRDHAGAAREPRRLDPRRVHRSARRRRAGALLPRASPRPRRSGALLLMATAGVLPRPHPVYSAARKGDPVAKDAQSFVETVKEWVGTLREDATTCKAVVAADDVSPAARRFAAAALNYLVTRLDLVPDHEPAIGAVDDAMAIRVALRYASDHGLDEGLDADVMVDAMRLANEADQIKGWLDADLDARFRKFVERQSELAVRGRTPEHIVKDAVARQRLFGEVDAELLRIPAAAFSDADAALRQFKSYLQTKLK